MTLTRSTISPLLEVRLSDGTRWRGTEAQLRRVHPDWLPYAQRVPQRSHHHPAVAPYGGHSASIHPDDMPYTTDEQAGDEEDALAGYPDERPRAAPPSAVRSLVGSEPEERRGLAPSSSHQVEWHVGQPPPVRRASRHQPHPKRPAPADGTVYQMPSAGGWRSHTESSATTVTAKWQRSRRRRIHPLLSLGLGMLVMFALWQAGIGVTSWWQLHQDDATYGRPRTYQVDAVVGHFDSVAHPSHFEAENLQRRVVVFELPGGDASKTRVSVGPLLYGPDADLAPVTLSFPVIGGKVAMVVNVQAIHLVYLNERVKGVWQFVQQQQG